MTTKRTALVTGGNRGIGLEVCRGLAKAGMRVLLGSRDQNAGEAAAASLKADGLVEAQQLDVADPKSVDACAKRLAKAGDAVKVNAVCPGWVHTRMGGSNAPRTPEKGAETVIWLTLLPDDGPTGQVFRDKRKLDW